MNERLRAIEEMHDKWTEVRKRLEQQVQDFFDDMETEFNDAKRREQEKIDAELVEIANAEKIQLREAI